jgi:hypothetical protein
MEVSPDESAAGAIAVRLKGSAPALDGAGADIFVALNAAALRRGAKLDG